MCEFCENFDFGSAKAVIEKFKSCTHAGVALSGGSYRFPVNEQFNYCPVCGFKNTYKQARNAESMLCTFEDSDYKPCELHAIDCEECEYCEAVD